MADLIEMTNVTDYPYARLAKTLCRADEVVYLYYYTPSIPPTGLLHFNGKGVKKITSAGVRISSPSGCSLCNYPLPANIPTTDPCDCVDHCREEWVYYGKVEQVNEPCEQPLFRLSNLIRGLDPKSCNIEENSNYRHNHDEGEEALINSMNHWVVCWVKEQLGGQNA
jgi:hypothetical protein